MKNTLLNEAKLAQKKIQKIKEVEQKAKDLKISQVASRRERFEAKILEIKNGLEEFQGIPLSFWYFSGYSGGYTVAENNYSEFSFTRETINTKEGCMSARFSLVYDRLTLDIHEEFGKVTMHLLRNAYSLDEVVSYTNLPEGRVWKTRGVDTIKSEFSEVAPLIEELKAFLLKVTDLERLEKLLIQKEEHALLASHLKITPDQILLKDNRNPFGARFEVNNTAYRVLKKNQAEEWMHFRVQDSPEYFLDLELAAKHSKIPMDEWKCIRDTLSLKTVANLCGKTINLNSYAKEYVSRYGFSKYVEAVGGFYIVNLGPVDE